MNNNDGKNRSEIGGLGSNEAPPSPFVSKKTGGELLEKLRTHSYAERTAQPEIVSRAQEREIHESEKSARDAERAPERNSNVISRMRETSKVIGDAEQNSSALVKIENEPEEEDTENVNERISERPKDDTYDIRHVFGIPEEESEDSDTDADNQEDSIDEKDELDVKAEFARLKKLFTACIPKLILLVLFALFTFFFENYRMFGISSPVFEKINSDVRISALASMQVTLFGILIMLREMRYGLATLVHFKAQPESFLPIMAFSVIIYQLSALFSGYNAFVSYNFAFFTVCIIYIGSKWLDLCRRLHTLKIISSKSVKYSLVRMKKNESAPEREATSGIMDLSEDAKYIRVVRSEKIHGYTARSESRMLYKRLSGVFIVASLVAAAVAVVFSKNSGSFFEGVRTVFALLVFVTPFSIYTVFSLPLYRVSRRAFKHGTAIVGEGATLEYCAPAFVTFNDTDIFTEKNVWIDEVAMTDSESFSKGLAYASVVFEPISGPLNKLFTGAADYEVTKESVDYVDISDDGLEAVVNRERVRIGQASYFTKYGYMLDDESSKNYRIMYVEIGNVLSLKIQLVYNIDKDFEKILQNLYKSGMGIVIRTSDPNINITMLESVIGTGRFPIKVIKYKTEKEMDVVRKTSDGGIVSKNKTRPLLETLYRCDRAGAVIKSGILLEVVAFVIGVAAVILFSSLGALGGVTSLHISLYHLFWSLLVWILSMIFV